MKTNSSKLYVTAGIMAVISVIFTVLVTKVNVQAIGPENSEVGFSGINGGFHDLTGYIPWLYNLTEVLGYLALLFAAGFALIGLLQLINKKSLRKVAPEILLLGVVYVVVFALYIIFDQVALNYRPVILDAAEGLEPSYPSSHTMLACTILGSGWLAIRSILGTDTLGRILQYVFLVMMVCIALGRMICGVHWLTDIIGSLLISGTLVAAYAGALAMTKEKQLGK